MLSVRAHLFYLAFVTFPLSLPSCVSAQDPIRVQSNQVLVPTVVYDEQLYERLNKMQPHRRDSYGHLVAKNERLWESIAVKDLTAKDFSLFEDGQEMRIQSLRLEPPSFRLVDDSLGRHPEIVGSGGGRWAYPDRPATELRYWLAWPQYVISYIPQASAPGSCHQIQVKVGRPNLVVWARSEYCNTKHPATDPLNGTDFGNKLEVALKSSKDSEIPLDLGLAAFPATPREDRVYLTLKFPGSSLRHEFQNNTLHATIGTMVQVYKQDGTLAARFSDFACCDYGNEKETSPSTTTSGVSPLEERLMLPDRYETQFDLAPGEYEVRVVLSDGENFGWQQAPLTVYNYDTNQIAISDVVLSRRIRTLPPSDARASGQVPENYTPLISKDVEYVPTTNMRFKKDEILYAYFEVSDPLLAGRSNVEAQAHFRILDANSGAVTTDFEPVDLALYVRAGSSLVSVGRGITLTNLPVGSYRLEVQATDAAGKNTPLRAVNFALEASVAAVSRNVFKVDTNNVIVNFTAQDAVGHPVTDLTISDLQVFDDDKVEPITSFQASSSQLTAGNPTSTTLILFDLLNTHPVQREYIASQITKVLEPLETDYGIYLYLLTNKGDLYLVRPNGVPKPGTSEKPEEPPWTKQIRPLLTHAIDVVHGVRSPDYWDPVIMAESTVTKLNELSNAFTKIPGPKTLLWITSGVSNSLALPWGGCRSLELPRTSTIGLPTHAQHEAIVDTYVAGICTWQCHPSPMLNKCLDLTPFLQHFATDLVQSDTILSSVEVTHVGELPDTDRGTPADTLRQLANLTGGRVYLDTNSEVETGLTESLKGARGRYRLAYAGPERDGSYHKLRVVCIREGVQIQAQQGYFAAAP